MTRCFAQLDWNHVRAQVVSTRTQCVYLFRHRNLLYRFRHVFSQGWIRTNIFMFSQLPLPIGLLDLLTCHAIYLWLGMMVTLHLRGSQSPMYYYYTNPQ